MIMVVKANGDKEEFDEKKLISSIKRAGISSDLQTEVLNYVKEHLYDNIPTHEIYFRIGEILDNSDRPFYRSRYSLKSALMELGPTGFPFESYIAEILKTQGFETVVGSILLGGCVNHEVDIIATNKDQKIMIECKFHNMPGSKSDIQVALYTKARFEDLREKHNFTDAMIITNTKMTLDAQSYSDCVKIKIMSWEHPLENSLRGMIENNKLYPITQLTFLSPQQKQELMSKGIILMKQICTNPNALDQILIPDDIKKEAIREAKNICEI